LKILDDKINLGGSEFFSKEIVEVMNRKFESSFIISAINCQPSVSRITLKNTKVMVEEVTKITQLLMVVVHTLFKEHKKDVSNVNDIEKDLKFIRVLWIKIESGIFKSKSEQNWEDNIHNILKLRKPDTSSSSTSVVNQGYRFRICFSFLHYWMEENGHPLKIKTELKKSYVANFTEVIFKSIYSSNYEIIKRHFDVIIKSKNKHLKE
jgi:hypothetical protein